MTVIENNTQTVPYLQTDDPGTPSQRGPEKEIAAVSGLQ